MDQDGIPSFVWTLIGVAIVLAVVVGILMIVVALLLGMF
jgi:hypothetical protein